MIMKDLQRLVRHHASVTSSGRFPHARYSMKGVVQSELVLTIPCSIAIRSRGLIASDPW